MPDSFFFSMIFLSLGIFSLFSLLYFSFLFFSCWLALSLFCPMCISSMWFCPILIVNILFPNCASWLLYLTFHNSPPVLLLQSLFSPPFMCLSSHTQTTFKHCFCYIFIACRVHLNYFSLSSMDLLGCSRLCKKHALSSVGEPSTQVWATCVSSYLLL